MSMVMSLVRIGNAGIERLLADPPMVWRIVSPDDPAPYLDERAPRPRGMALLMARLLGLKSAEPLPPVPELPLAKGEGESLDLDKAWHGIHYLLTRSGEGGEPPLGFLLRGGREVGDVDVGYGPARVLTAAEVRAAHEALERLPDAELRGRFDTAAMMASSIYPTIWDRDPAEDDTLGYLMAYVTELRRFLAETADAGIGLVIYLC